MMVSLVYYCFKVVFFFWLLLHFRMDSSANPFWGWRRRELHNNAEKLNKQTLALWVYSTTSCDLPLLQTQLLLHVFFWWRVFDKRHKAEIFNIFFYISNSLLSQQPNGDFLRRFQLVQFFILKLIVSAFFFLPWMLILDLFFWFGSCYFSFQCRCQLPHCWHDLCCFYYLCLFPAWFYLHSGN